MFVPLKVTTEYSLMKSLIKVPDLISFLEKNKLSVCGICDENLFGVMEFYDTCMSKNIQPLIGLELSFSSVLFYVYARGYEGYIELLKLNTKKEEDTLSIHDLETISSYVNIILPYEYINQYKEYASMFSHLYIGYTTEYEKNNAMILTTKLLFCPNLKMFLVKDSFYLNLLRAIDSNNPYSVIEKEDYSKNSFEYYQKENVDDECLEEFIATSKVEIPKNIKRMLIL